MRIVVTGSSGRVGSAVVDLAVREGHEVTGVDLVDPGPERPGVRFVQVDLREYGETEAAFSGCDALVHLAAIAGPGRDPDHIIHGHNVVTNYHALLAAAEVGIRRVCQASSVNAIGLRFSARPRFDYFPLDEEHPSYAEDPYSLSKVICEQQADAIARRFDGMSIASLRLHAVVGDPSQTRHWLDSPDRIAERQLWGYTDRTAAARACLLGVTAGFHGHQVVFVVAPETMTDTPSLVLWERHYPEVPVRGDLSGTRGFFDCRRAAEVLGWVHDG